MKEMLEKHRIKRNVLFWGKQALQMIKLLLLFAIGYGVLFNLGNLSLHKICETAYFYGMIIGIMFAFVEAISYFSAYMPLVISFGSTRREAVWGTQLMNLIYSSLAYVIILLLGLLSTGKTIAWINISVAGAFLLMTGIGQFCSVAQIRFGQKGLITGVATAVLVAVVGIIIGIGYANKLVSWAETLSVSIMTVLLTLVLAVSTLFYGVSLFVLFKSVKNLEVKM